MIRLYEHISVYTTPWQAQNLDGQHQDTSYLSFMQVSYFSGRRLGKNCAKNKLLDD